jgi:hypothetical protein
MFAGLPGIGVGTLFYVVAALWMPLRECPRLLTGKSSLARWRVIGVQFCFALSIIASIAVADRVLLWMLGDGSPTAINPARLINEEFAARVPQSIFAAPIAASLVLLAVVLLATELLRLATIARSKTRRSDKARRSDNKGEANPAPASA